MRGTNLLGVAFRVIGLTFAVVCVVTAGFTLAFVMRSDAVSGEVVAQSHVQNQISVMPQSSETGVLHYPVISYTGPDGLQRQFTGPRGRAREQFTVGEEVSVLMSRTNPADVRMNTLLGVWGTPVIVGLLAAIFFVLSFAAPFGFGGLEKK